MLAMLNRPFQALAPDSSAAGSGGSPASVLDPAALARLAELDPSGANRLLERVLQAFQTSVTRLRPQLSEGRAADDRSAIRLVTHTLKSSSASIGAMRLSQLCAEIETAIRLDPAAELHAKLDALDVALDDTVRAISVRLGDRG
jgi:HPt (histidine-containing phosphotransfer) domain-containing protein